MPGATRGTENRVLLVCRLLNTARVRYLLVGGVAANLHGTVRATRDVDLLIPKDLENTRRVLAALAELPYRIAGELNAEEVVRKPFTIVGDEPRVDLLTAAGGLTFERAWPRRVVRRISGVRVPYVGLDDLRVSKQTGRPSDQADLAALDEVRRTRRRRRP